MSFSDPLSDPPTFPESGCEVKELACQAKSTRGNLFWIGVARLSGLFGAFFFFSFWLSFAFVFFYLYYCMPFPAGTKFGKLVLVDLAGYERFAATGITTVGSLALLVLVCPPQINWRGFWGETSKQCSLGVIK